MNPFSRLLQRPAQQPSGVAVPGFLSALQAALRPCALLLLAVLAAGCSDDADDMPFPALVTELVMAQADAQGAMDSFVTDAGTTYTVTNTITGMDAGSRLRCLCGYVVEEAGRAVVYSAQEVPILPNVTSAQRVRRDPTGIESAWLSGGFINMHLTPMTHGGKQGWAFLCDSVTPNAAAGHTLHLSLYHDLADDAASYTTDLYACIALDSLTVIPLPASAATATASAPTFQFSVADSIRLIVNTFKGPSEWLFAR